MSKLIQRAGFFLIGLLISTDGFSARIIPVSDGGGGVGIIGPRGEAFLIYGEGSDKVSIKECVVRHEARMYRGWKSPQGSASTHPAASHGLMEVTI